MTPNMNDYYSGKVLIIHKALGLSTSDIKKHTKATTVRSFNSSKTKSDAANEANKFFKDNLLYAIGLQGADDVNDFNVYQIHGDQVSSIFLRLYNEQVYFLDFTKEKFYELYVLLYLHHLVCQFRMSLVSCVKKLDEIKAVDKKIQFQIFANEDNAGFKAMENYGIDAIHTCRNRISKLLTDAW